MILKAYIVASLFQVGVYVAGIIPHFKIQN